MRFFNWCSVRDFDVMAVNPIHLAGYRESLKSEDLEPASIKRHFSALRMLYAWWVEKGVLVTNPLREVKTEKVSRQEGETPASEVEDMPKLFASFDIQSIVGLLVLPRGSDVDTEPIASLRTKRTRRLAQDPGHHANAFDPSLRGGLVELKCAIYSRHIILKVTAISVTFRIICHPIFRYNCHLARQLIMLAFLDHSVTVSVAS